MPSTAIGTVVGPADLDSHAAAGAVIFGQSGNLLKSLVNAQHHQKKHPDVLYSQPNRHIEVDVTVNAAAAAMDQQQQVIVQDEEGEEKEEQEDIKDSDSSDHESLWNSTISLDSSCTTQTFGNGAGDGGNEGMCVSRQSVGAEKRQFPIFARCDDYDDDHWLPPVKQMRHELSVQEPQDAEHQGEQNHRLRSRPGNENLTMMVDRHHKEVFVPSVAGFHKGIHEGA